MHREGELLTQIREATTPELRDTLIVELERTPVKMREFYSRWLFIHTDSTVFACWSDDGYDPMRSSVPRDIQLLAAADYGKSDIDNGGLHQFFGNRTGTFAPEMVEWFDRAGLKETASVIREAMAVFGPEFPRSQDARRKFLDGFQGKDRSEWDPFYKMSDRFYATLKGDVFEQAADRWLRETCGIISLRDTY
jgi:hypothetical protein